MIAFGLSCAGVYAQFQRGPVDPNAKSYPGGDRIWLTPLHSIVLPRDLTAQQRADLMEQWKVELGAHCTTCHVLSKDPKNLNSNGYPEVEPYNDSMPEFKATVRMIQMMADMNQKYFASSKAPVACGTCHRGKVVPEKFVGIAEGSGPRQGQQSANGQSAPRGQ